MPAWVRIVRARLVARDFKVMQAYIDRIKTCSGTATKWAHRAVNANAERTGYTLFSVRHAPERNDVCGDC
eukprot:3703700-Prorocentrum_lima.AAC.1